eukprot:13462436-Heterocapsa_arctica.AAC.1
MIRAFVVPSSFVFRMRAKREKLPSAKVAMACSREIRTPYPCSRKRASSAAASVGLRVIEE